MSVAEVVAVAVETSVIGGCVGYIIGTAFYRKNMKKVADGYEELLDEANAVIRECVCPVLAKQGKCPKELGEEVGRDA